MTEVNIDSKGYLEIKRGGSFDTMECPYREPRVLQGGGYIPTYCGDWCALFGEPKECDESCSTLRLCQKTIVCKLTDARVK